MIEASKTTSLRAAISVRIEWFECSEEQDLGEYSEYGTHSDHQYASYMIPLTPPVMVTESQTSLTFDRDAVASAT
ncbi:hypothetical protein AAVH_41108 [Aphelenchoides avenae]|nr:hypothetical protein AAVH_41108 [Aphelenchus avenae]